MNKRRTLGVLIGNANSPHTLEMMQGISTAAKEADYNVYFYLGIHSSHYSQEYFGINVLQDFDYQFNVVYDYALLEDVDFLLVPYGSIGIFLSESDRRVFFQKFKHIPLILLEEDDPTHTYNTIITDNYHGMYEVVEHLIRDHGYRKIAYLSGPANNTDAKQRQQAFLDVMKAYDLPVPPERIEVGDFSDCVGSQIRNLLDHTPGLEALVCANDLMANTAYDECKARGLVVGKDIAITGFDDWSGAASMDPPLTTVLQDSYEMGLYAVKVALEVQKGQTPASYISPSRVQYRASCGCTTPDTVPRRRIVDDNDSLQAFRQKAWFLPIVSKDMFSHLEDEALFYQSTLDKLPSFGMSHSAIYVFPEPVIHRYGEPWVLPEKMYLAAHSNTSDGSVVTYSPEERPEIQSSPGFASFDGHSLFQKSIFCLFSGEYQYGILVSEIQPENLSLTYLISTQIGSALRYLHMAQAQEKTQRQLKKLIQEINEKNEILNSLSDYDTLTRCLNRRGLFRRAQKLAEENLGTQAWLLMCDLDHLKEINDTFGHTEGDFAIRRCATALEESLSPETLIARIGGDEFVAILFPEEPFSAETVIASIKENLRHFNKGSDRPFYVEMSIGFTSFLCQPGTEFPDLITLADQDLYRNKKVRRASSLKERTVSES